MEGRFQNTGFAGNHSVNGFKVLGSSLQGTEDITGFSADTVLRLDSPGFSIPCMASFTGMKRKWCLVDGYRGQQIDSSLSLGLGRSSSSSDSKGSSATACTTISSAKETDEESSMDIELDFSLSLGNEKLAKPQNPSSANMKMLKVQPELDLELSLSYGRAESEITTIYPIATQTQSCIDMPARSIPTVDEGSKLCHWKCGMALSPFCTLTKEASLFSSQAAKIDIPISVVPDLSSSIITKPKSSVSCTSGITQQLKPQHRNSSSKLCQIEGCEKGARGASGYCISHGGGRRCQRVGCLKGAEGRTVYCKAHGGGRRCDFLGCTKSAEGRTDFCIAHGGGRRCSHESCTRAARGKSGLCIRHGGGKRCQVENCTKSAEGLSGHCISHGGGRRCQFIGCTKGAQGSTMFCKAHGGGKRCTYLGCNKGAEGSTPFCKGHGGGKRCSFQGGGICAKSVHGGTNFCVAHGGGKRCAVSECTKSARGRTDFCVRHGGGKRCHIEGCGKSAQGSTDFCKAHGGGKRCAWGHPGTEYANQSSGPCNSFARGKTGLCALHSGLVQDRRVHGGFTLGPVIKDPQFVIPEKAKEIVSASDMMIDTPNLGTSLGKAPLDLKQYENSTSITTGDISNFAVAPTSFPEGRVHGGSLLAMLAASSGSCPGSSSKSKDVTDQSENRKSYVLRKSWL